MVEKGNGNVRSLMWIAGAIVVCVTVAWFLDQDVKTWSKACHDKIQQHVDITNQFIKEDLREMHDDIKKILERIK
jgi:hypothetical protein